MKAYICSLSVLIVTIFLGLPSPAHAASASFSFQPSTASVTAESALSVGVFLTSRTTSVNAASGVISFPPDKLEVLSLDTSDSILNLWVEKPTFSNTEGTITFGGVAFNPGFKGEFGKILTVRFKAKGEGSARVAFVSDTVLANDGRGTELTTDGNVRATFKVSRAVDAAGFRSLAVEGTDSVAGASQNVSSWNGDFSPADIAGLSLAAIALVCSLYVMIRLRRFEGKGKNKRI